MTLVHNDLTGDNIFIDKTNLQYLGVVDFSDSVVGDLARDFAALFTFDEKFVRKVLKYYDAKNDTTIFERAQVYYRDEAIKLMYLAINGSDFISEKDALKLLHERFNIKRA